MMESGDQRMRIDIPLERSEAVLEELLIALPGETSMIRLGDVASVSREETNLPSLIVRHEGNAFSPSGLPSTKPRTWSGWAKSWKRDCWNCSNSCLSASR
jgi:hypothetical protein